MNQIDAEAPTRYDTGTWGRVLEEIAFQCEEAAFPIVLSMSTGVARVLLGAGREDSIRDYVKPIVSGTRTATLAFSEDADLFSLRSRLPDVPKTAATGCPGARRTSREDWSPTFPDLRTR